MAKRKKYGTPYQGSKSTIAEFIIGKLPSAKHLYDLFAGGCALSHCALLSGKYDTIHANDLSDSPQLFLRAVNGGLKDEKRWISREDFFALRSTDPYVRISWSFGNNGKDYLYSRKIEPYKKACHYAIVLDKWELLAELCPEIAEPCRAALEGITDTKERRMTFGPTVVKWLKANGTAEMVEGNPLYNSCHKKKVVNSDEADAVRRLQSLESLESLERLETTQLDYREVEIAEDSVIVCDIPYNTQCGKSKKHYDVDFDHAAFFDWAAKQTQPLFICEYNISDDRFVEYASISKVCSLSASTTTIKQEKLYIPRHQQAMIEGLINNQEAIWGAER